MIWFACKKCSKVHGRPESSAGAMIFCECGQSMNVPWESTAAEPPMPTPVELPSTPTLDPLTFPSTSSGGSYDREAGQRRDRDYGRDRDDGRDFGRPTRGRRRRKHVADPNICFNHDRTASKTVCRDCGLGFCEQCLVEFDGQSLCGPCKNFRVRQAQRPQETPGLAILALLGSLLATAPFFCLLPIGRQSDVQLPYLGMLAIVPEIGALLAAFVVLSRLRKSGATAGRWLAFAAIAASAVISFLIGVVTIYGHKVQA